MHSLLGRELTPDERALKVLLRRVLTEQQRRPARSSIRAIAARNPEAFLGAAIAVLDSESLPNARWKLYMQLLECPEFLLQLVQPDRFSPKQFLAVCRSLKEIDDFLDLRLARLAPGRHADDHGLAPEVVLRLLDVLHVISSGPRLVPVLGHLTRYPDKHIASKATMLLGNRLRSENWLRNQLQSKDARVRASLVEGLWGVDTLFARKCMWESLEDGNNRVVGNGLFGLYLLGEPTVDRSVERMLCDSRPNFRRTAAWLMGRMGKPGFAEPLHRAAQDSDPGVRETAKRALGAIPVAQTNGRPQPVANPAPPKQTDEAAAETPQPPKDAAALGPRLDGTYIRGL